MLKWTIFLAAGLLLLAGGGRAQDAAPPTLDDFWEGRAGWVLEARDVGLPVGESDTEIGRAHV